MCRSRGSRWRRKQRSTFVGCGNFGAPPNPPSRASKARRSPAIARSRGSGPRAAAALPSPARAPARLRPREGRAQRLVLLRHLAAVGGEKVHDPDEQVAERGEAVARRRRKVGAAEEGGQVVRGEEHRERPAAGAAREQLVRDLVDPVEVRALLAVHLDVDEVLVHHPRGGLVLERFVGHDVAPVARGVADGEEDRPALPPRAVEGFRPPRVPVHRIVRVLEEVGAGLGGEAVPAGGWRGHESPSGSGADRTRRRRPRGGQGGADARGRGQGQGQGSVAYNPGP